MASTLHRADVPVLSRFNCLMQYPASPMNGFPELQGVTMGHSSINEYPHGVTRVIARALCAAFPTADNKALPEARRAFAALNLIDDMIGLLPEPADLSAFMAQLYAVARKTEGDSLRVTRLGDTYRRIEQATNGVRSYYVTADHARLTQAETVVREAFAVLHDHSYVRVLRGDEVGYDVIAAMLIGEYPSGRKFELAVTWDVSAQQWRMEGGVYSDDSAAVNNMPPIDETIGKKLDNTTVSRFTEATLRLIRACSTTPIQLHSHSRTIR